MINTDSMRGLVEEGELKFSAEPIAYNAALAKLMQKLKKDVGATAIRQGYKGGGKQSHRRQIWVSMPDHSRGGPDVWLDNGYVKIGGVIQVPAEVPRMRQYGDDTPETVYGWIRDALKALNDWSLAQYTKESIMNPELNKKLEDLRTKLENHIKSPEVIGVSSLTSGSTPKMPAGSKNKFNTPREVETNGAQSKPPAKKAAGSVLPSKVAESVPGFRRLAGLEDLRQMVAEK